MQNGYQSTNSWIIEEMATANLGDARLNHRVGNILEMLSRKPPESIPVTAKSWAETKAAYRFFDNAEVTKEKMIIYCQL